VYDLYFIPKISEFLHGKFVVQKCFGHNDLRDGPCGVIFSMSSWSSARRHYNVVMQEMLNPLYLTFPVLERLPTPRNIRYKKAVDHMFKVLEGCLPPSESGSGA